MIAHRVAVRVISSKLTHSLTLLTIRHEDERLLNNNKHARTDTRSCVSRVSAGRDEEDQSDEEMPGSGGQDREKNGKLGAETSLIKE